MPLLVIGANSIAAYCIAHLWEDFIRESYRTHLGPSVLPPGSGRSTSRWSGGGDPAGVLADPAVDAAAADFSAALNRKRRRGAGRGSRGDERHHQIHEKPGNDPVFGNGGGGAAGGDGWWGGGGGGGADLRGAARVEGGGRGGDPAHRRRRDASRALEPGGDRDARTRRGDLVRDHDAVSVGAGDRAVRAGASDRGFGAAPDLDVGG